METNQDESLEGSITADNNNVAAFNVATANVTAINIGVDPGPQVTVDLKSATFNNSHAYSSSFTHHNRCTNDSSFDLSAGLYLIPISIDIIWND